MKKNLLFILLSLLALSCFAQEDYQKMVVEGKKYFNEITYCFLQKDTFKSRTEFA